MTVVFLIVVFVEVMILCGVGSDWVWLMVADMKVGVLKRTLLGEQVSATGY